MIADGININKNKHLEKSQTKHPSPKRCSGGFRSKIDLQVASYSITFLFFYLMITYFFFFLNVFISLVKVKNIH